jgi:hypothetical protein
MFPPQVVPVLFPPNEWAGTDVPRPPTAKGIAQSVRDSSSRHCAGKGPTGERFFEGRTRTGALQGHDGGENETTLMPFYGFCGADDPRLLNHASQAMTKENPLYSAELDGIRYNASWSWAMFPGGTTALAGVDCPMFCTSAELV